MYVKIFVRYAVGLLAFWPVVVAGLMLVAAWSSARARAALARLPKARLLGLAALLALAMTCAWRLVWFADDAFISLHYARNWVEGRGLVYNPGEYVEGYTNFLWLALVAACGRVGLDMPLATLGLNLLSYAAVIALALRAVRRLETTQDVTFSLAALMTAMSYPMLSFATGGLETVFCAMLVLAAAMAAQADRPLAAGSLAIFATMGHPDHALFYVAIGAVLLGRTVAELVAARRAAGGAAPAVSWWRRSSVRGLLWYAAPFVLLYLPYFALRWRYYGDPLPNTFYTKSGGGAYYAQGLRYLLLSALIAGLLGVLPAFALGAYRLRRTVFGQIVMVAVPLYLGYVVRLGGDFMVGRLLVPVLPLAFVTVELGLRGVRGRRVLAAALAAPVVLACLPISVLHPEETRWYLADERTYWRVDQLHPMTLHGETAHRAEILRKYFPQAGPSLAYATYEIGYVAWRTRLRIVDLHGLIDRELAHQPLVGRGRPGHEREASEEHVLAKGAHLSRKPLYAAPHDAFTALTLDGEPYFLAQFRQDLLDQVRGKPGVEILEMPKVIDDYMIRAATVPEAAFAADLGFFDAFYFSVNPDPTRRAALLAARQITPR